MVTSAEEVMSCASVLMSVTVRQQDITKIYDRIFMKFSGAVGHRERKNQLDFGGDADFFVDTESFSLILWHYERGCTTIGAAIW